MGKASWCSKFEQGSRAADYSKACSPETALESMELLMAHVLRASSQAPVAMPREEGGDDEAA